MGIQEEIRRVMTTAHLTCVGPMSIVLDLDQSAVMGLGMVQALSGETAQ
jgi:hypothetical protein